MLRGEALTRRHASRDGCVSIKYHKHDHISKPCHIAFLLRRTCRYLTIVLMQDLVIPAYKSPEAIGRSPLLGAASQERTTLLFFRGNMGETKYSH